MMVNDRCLPNDIRNTACLVGFRRLKIRIQYDVDLNFTFRQKSKPQTNNRGNP